MKRVLCFVVRVVIAAVVLCSGVNRIHAQAPAQDPAKTPAPAQEPGKEAAKAPQAEEEEENPFAPEPAPALPAGMSGSDVNDPRAKLTPGLYDAGETSMGIKHLLLLKKPDAFQLGANDPDDPKVQ